MRGCVGQLEGFQQIGSFDDFVSDHDVSLNVCNNQPHACSFVNNGLDVLLHELECYFVGIQI